MDNSLYDYSPIVERPKLSWPNGARVAFYIGLNVEYFHLGKPSTSIYEGTSGLQPDPLNHGWRDYGVRVGFWRLLDIFDKVGIRPSVLLNSEVADHYPQIIEAGKQRDWAWLAHGQTNSQLHSGFADDQERGILKNIVETIESATGQRPKGWMGPGLSETFEHLGY
jgi:allantoinase